MTGKPLKRMAIAALASGVLLAPQAGTASAVLAWNTDEPARNAAIAVDLFALVCVSELGNSRAMQQRVEGSQLGFQTSYPGDEEWGPVFVSPFATISAHDHGHHHDGDSCELHVAQKIAPDVPTVLAVLRERKLVSGEGEPGELGATVFKQGPTELSVRYDVPQSATGVTADEAGLTLIIWRPPA